MNLIIDLRFVFPPLVNLILFLFLTSPYGKSDNWELQDGTAFEILQFPISKLPFLMLLILLLLFFLFTSITLPLTANPIRLRAGNFSALLALAIVASLMLPPSLFWFSYLFLIMLAPLYGKLWSLFKHFFSWLRRISQSFPTIFIIFSTQNQENQELAAPQVEQIGSPEIEQDLVLVIDG
ncbi:hypothetical protein ACOSQ4_025695 [Xanthoceras sorbifolium]